MAKKKKQDIISNPKVYMELAIEEMNKSLNEPRPDGKVPPKVGAIIVFPDGRIERAHRGELREGDHAEYTLLERKLANEKLDECILFTTLEPCYQRNHPKIACCKRTSNARIKTVYVGIGDPDPTVDGKGIDHLRKHGVEVHMFDRDLQQQIADANKQFIEQAIERKNEKKQEPLPLLEQPVSDFDVSDFSDEALLKFIKEANLDFTPHQAEFHKYMANLGALSYDDKSKTYKPTGVGILLFGKNPRHIFKQAALKAKADYGARNIEVKEFNEPLVLVPDLIEEWLHKVLHHSKDTTAFKRRDIPDFPIPVLREAIVNALVHRDYTIEGAKSSLEIDNDKIVIKSPGEPHPAITLEQLKSFNAPSISRNPIISYVFSLMKYVEEMGFGMQTLKSLNEKYGLPLPVYSYENPFLVLTFPRSIESVKNVSSNTSITELSNDELKGYEWIRQQRIVSKKEYAKHFGFDDKKALRHLSKMRKLGILKGEGRSNSPDYRYIIIDE